MTNAHQPEDITAYNESSLKALVRSLALSQGNFKLILARCNYGALRDRMVQRVRELSPVEIRELVLQKSVKSLHTTIKTELGDEIPPALMVFGLESVSNLKTVLTSSNYVREEFSKNFSFPLILWINDEVLQKLLRLAPDLGSWATSVEFAIATDELIEFLQQEADSLFAKVLEAGADRFVDNAALNLGMGTGKRFELESALKELQSRGCHEPALEASQQFILGRDAYVNDQMERAQQLYERSLAFWKQSHDLERQACLLFHLGLLWRKYAVLHRAEYKPACGRARDYYQQCLEVSQQANRPDLVAKFINALGEVLLQLMAWDELETLAKEAVELHQTYPDFLRLANAYGFLAEVDLAKSAWDEAKQYAQTALETIAQLSESASDSKNQDIASVWVGQHLLSWYQFLLAQAEQHLERVPEALQNLETARVNCKHEYEPLLYLRILEALRSLYFQQGEYLKAFEIKRKRRLLEYQYGFQAFAGASLLAPKQQVIHPALVQTGQQAIVAQEIAASGREQDVKRLIERISSTHHKLIVIHGQSGVGKSSIIKAGLVPALKQQVIDARDTLPIVVRVYTNWVRELGRAIAEELEEIRGVKLPETLDSVEAIAEQLQKNENHNLLTVLIFDQFEEFFFVCTDKTERRPFFEFLRNCLNISFVKVILSLREDYLHYLLEAERFVNLDAINNNILDKNIRYYLGNFSQEDAKAVIQRLTERSHFYLEHALIDKLVKDLAGEVGEVRPIELQIVGAQLQTHKITTLQQYENLGSAPKVRLVEQLLQEVITDCGCENESTAWKILYSLTDERGISPLRTKDDLVSIADEKTETIDLILQILVGSGLLVMIREEPSNRYQLIHDYLVSPIRRNEKFNNYFISLLKHPSSIQIEIKAYENTYAKVVSAKAFINTTDEKTRVPIRILRDIKAKPIGEKQYISGLATKTARPYLVSIKPEGYQEFYDVEVFDWEGHILRLGRDFIQKLL